jgi:hypothetical protein
LVVPTAKEQLVNRQLRYIRAMAVPRGKWLKIRVFDDSKFAFNRNYGARVITAGL